MWIWLELGLMVHLLATAQYSLIIYIMIKASYFHFLPPLYSLCMYTIFSQVSVLLTHTKSTDRILSLATYRAIKAFTLRCEIALDESEHCLHRKRAITRKKNAHAYNQATFRNGIPFSFCPISTFYIFITNTNSLFYIIVCIYCCFSSSSFFFFFFCLSRQPPNATLCHETHSHISWCIQTIK